MYISLQNMVKYDIVYSKGRREQMKEEKNINYYRNLLHSDSITLLVVAIIFAIANLLFMGNGYDEAVPVFLKSIMFAIFSIILICNKKETKKFIGTFSIVISCLMILTSIGDGSLFGIVYILLGIFLGIHAFFYLKKFGNSDIQLDYSSEVIVKNKKAKYVSLIPILITIILVILGIKFNQPLIGISWCSILIFLVNIVNIVLCIILHHKKIQSILVYMMLVLSIMIALFSGVFLIDEIGQNIRKNNYNNSESYLIDKCKNIENTINDDISLLENLISLNVNIGENDVVELDDYLALDTVSWIDIVDLQELKEDGYVCDGYIILDWESDLDITSYDDVSSKLPYPFNMKNYFKNIKTYIKCNGKYSYQTNGFNEDIVINN